MWLTPPGTARYFSFKYSLKTLFFPDCALNRAPKNQNKNSRENIWPDRKKCLTLHSQNGGIAQLVRASDS